jgi:uncharacterized protein (TIGR04222 family)
MKLFPFNLTGPHFLWFFIVFGLCVVMIPLYRRRTSPSHDGSPLPHLTDPIEIATLRAGYEEAVRLALIVLDDRGLIKLDGKTFRSLDGGADSIREPLELVILERDGRFPDFSAVLRQLGLARAALARGRARQPLSRSAAA